MSVSVAFLWRFTVKKLPGGLRGIITLSSGFRFLRVGWRFSRRFIGDSKLDFAVSLKTLRAFFVFVNFSLAIKTFFSQVI